MTAQLGQNHPRVNGIRRDAVIRQAAIEFDGKENVRGLRLPVGLPLVVRSVLVVKVVQDEVGHAVAGRAQVDDS